ncbi:hypothetical protein D9Q98_009191 [Chlorella vulgaris]|uniref:Apple domain-containing protein n=1 Tax=Chlorella vulgaris TaxID=3077 RepID=A0A9D4TPC5_CHLVU|nr:hypothetical protein D9Q98_009191 [Chlorella vulgaris]
MTPARSKLVVLAVLLCMGAAHGSCDGQPTLPAAAARSRRSLLASPPSAAPAPAPSPAAAAPELVSNASQAEAIIETLVYQKCSVMHHALLSGPELVSAAANLQPDAFACCQSCLQHPDNCTAWVYCPLQGGCHAPTTNATLTAVAGDSLLQLWEPYQGCRLLSPQAFALQSNSPQIIARGIEVPHVAGIPVVVNLPVLPNYSVRPGTDVARGLGYSCDDSVLLSTCMRRGTAEELAAACTDDPLCAAFVFLPNGLDSMSSPLGIFKGGHTVHSLPLGAIKPNPNTALYIKSSVEVTTLPWGGGSAAAVQCDYADAGYQGSRSCSCKAHTLWIVLPTLLAAALVMVAAVAGYATIAIRQQAREREAAAAAAAAAGSSRQSGKGSPPPSSSQAAALQAVVPGPPVALPACLTLHLLKPSPPGSANSDRSAASGASGGSSRTSCGTSAGVACPQCGATLGLAAAAPVCVPAAPSSQQRRQHKQRQQHEQQQQQEPPLQRPQQQQQQAPPLQRPQQQQQQHSNTNTPLSLPPE